MMNSISKPAVPIMYAAERLQEASQQLGMTEDDVAAILTSGITMVDMLDYVDAMMQNQTN
jgi:hypothetical protein